MSDPEAVFKSLRDILAHSASLGKQVAESQTDLVSRAARWRSEKSASHTQAVTHLGSLVEELEAGRRDSQQASRSAGQALKVFLEGLNANTTEVSIRLDEAAESLHSLEIAFNDDLTGLQDTYQRYHLGEQQAGQDWSSQMEQFCSGAVLGKELSRGMDGAAGTAESAFASTVQIEDEMQRQANAAEALHLNQQAAELCARGSLAAAQVALKAAAALDPASLEIRANLARLYLRMHCLEQAIQACETMENLAPNAPETARVRGLVQYHQGDFAGAIQSIEESLACAPSGQVTAEVESRFYLAAAHFAAGQPRQALTEWRLALAADPHCQPAANWIQWVE